MPNVSAIIIGAGQAGLAMSQCLSRRGIEHVVLERGGIGERWRSERWDSLRLLTPNWMTRLPGWRYRGEDPDGFMPSSGFAAYLATYAAASAAPVVGNAPVLAVRPYAAGYRVETSSGSWHAPTVVIATGHCDIPATPAIATSLSAAIHQLTPSQYRNPNELAYGGVLVVGASATGVQIADEIQATGRQVVLAVGRHTRLPRRYRGRDIWWWLDRSGILDETIDSVADPERARRMPSFQLVGRPDGRTIDLATLRAAGVRLVGRVAGVDGPRLRLHDDLAETTAAAQRALERLLPRLDMTADRHGAPATSEPICRIVAGPAPTALDLAAEGIRCVIWATGFRRAYPWLAVPVLDDAGEVIHSGGVTPAPGLYALGLRFMRRRRSNLIDGVGDDAEVIARHLAGYLTQPMRTAA